MIEICGLWEKTSKKGQKYWTGTHKNQKWIVLPNLNRKTEKHPNYIIWLTEASTKQSDNNTNNSTPPAPWENQEDPENYDHQGDPF